MRLKLVGKKPETKDAWSFYFKPQDNLSWLAGQSIRLEIPRKTWGYTERRFTIASAMHEDHIQITTRISDSDFKQQLATLDLNEEISGYNIEGDFILTDPKKPKLFIAGGVGITPFRAIISELVINNQSDKVNLLYSSRDNPAIFQEELKAWQGIAQNFSFEVFNQRINHELITKCIPDWHERLIYVSGPSKMVQEISKDLISNGLKSENLRQDLFTGKVQ